MANVIILPMAFISDVFIAIEDPPRWLDTLGDVLPLKPFAQSFQDAFNPAVTRRRSTGAGWRASPRGASSGSWWRCGGSSGSRPGADRRGRRRHGSRRPSRPDAGDRHDGRMHPELTEEHEALREVVREFVEAEIEPHAEAWDRDHTFPVETVLAMGELGLFGIPFPEPYGGGGDLTGLCVAIEEIARADQSLAITLEAGVGLGANPIHKFGTPEQQERWLPDLCAGRTLGGFGLTEPDAGSDAGGTRTRATLDGSAGSG